MLLFSVVITTWQHRVESPTAYLHAVCYNSWRSVSATALYVIQTHLCSAGIVFPYGSALLFETYLYLNKFVY